MTPLLLALLAGACDSSPVPYGRESQITLGLPRSQVWAVAPAVNLSGQPGVDPLLQGDLCYQQLQQVKGLTCIPVDRVVTVYAALGLVRVQSAEQAALVCDLLGADGLLVPTVTAFEPYAPPKMGASLALFVKPGTYARDESVDPRELARRASPVPGTALPPSGRNGFYQSVGMFDAADGSTRDSIRRYAYGRHDPLGPYGESIYTTSSDHYATFVYRRLTEQLLDQMFLRAPAAGEAEDGKAKGGDGKNGGIPDGGPAGPQPFPSNRR